MRKHFEFGAVIDVDGVEREEVLAIGEWDGVTNDDYVFYWLEPSFECIDALSRLPEQPFGASGFKVISIDDDGLLGLSMALRPVFIDGCALDLLGFSQRYIESRDLSYAVKLSQLLPEMFSGMNHMDIDTALLLFMFNDLGFTCDGLLSREFCVFELTDGLEFLHSYGWVNGEIEVEDGSVNEPVDVVCDMGNNRLRVIEWLKDGVLVDC